MQSLEHLLGVLLCYPFQRTKMGMLNMLPVKPPHLKQGAISLHKWKWLLLIAEHICLANDRMEVFAF